MTSEICSHLKFYVDHRPPISCLHPPGLNIYAEQRIQTGKLVGWSDSYPPFRLIVCLGRTVTAVDAARRGNSVLLAVRKALRCHALASILPGRNDQAGVSPTCSAFSTLRRIFDGLSGPGKGSSVPAIGSSPVRNIYTGQLMGSLEEQYPDLRAKRGVFQHNRTIAELLDQAVFALDS